MLRWTSNNPIESWLWRSIAGLVSNGVRCSKNGVRCSLLCSTFYLLCSQPPVVFAVVFACCSVRTLFCSALRSCYVRRCVRMQIVVFAVLFALDLLVGLNQFKRPRSRVEPLVCRWLFCSLFCSTERVNVVFVVRWTVNVLFACSRSRSVNVLLCSQARFF